MHHAHCWLRPPQKIAACYIGYVYRRIVASSEAEGFSEKLTVDWYQSVLAATKNRCELLKDYACVQLMPSCHWLPAIDFMGKPK